MTNKPLSQSTEGKAKMSSIKDMSSLSIKVFADGASLPVIENLAKNPIIQGFTTNPTLMRNAGVTDYELFAKNVISIIDDRPLSLEVFSDDWAEMEHQARKLASWGSNVYVKIPITNTKAESSAELVRRLTSDGVQVNVTAILTIDQVLEMRSVLSGGAPSCISIFAGRVADAGVDPLPLMMQAINELSAEPQIEVIWASPREVLNLVQADSIGCHIITVTSDLLKKLPLLGKDLTEFSLETVTMFTEDAISAGYKL